MPTLPDVQVVASSLDGRILAALGGLMNRDDGPLVCFDIQTGGILETFDIRDQSAVAAFLGPSDERFIAAWEDEGRFRTALFDTMTGKRLAELPFIEYRVTGFRLSADQSKVLFDHVLDADNNAYAFLDLATRRFVGSLPLPADGSVSLLDMRQDTLLLLSRSDSKAWVSAWSYARQNADPVEIFALPRNGAAVETCFLAGRGDTVVRCGSNGSIHLYAADGRTLGDYQLGTRIRSFAAQPRGNLVAFAVDTDLIIFDLDSSQVISQFSKALGQATGRVPSLSWFMGP